MRKKAPAKSFPIVGIGASAGGLEAVTELLQALPANPGMAFVVMQHLDPTHESALPTLLGRVTNLPVAEAKQNLRVEVNRVYVIPPNKAIRVAGRRLKVTPRRTEKDVRMPIDEFLVSLATEEGSNAIGVVLSGNGSDGTAGLMAIKTAGASRSRRTRRRPSTPPCRRARSRPAAWISFCRPPRSRRRWSHLPAARRARKCPSCRPRRRRAVRNGLSRRLSR